MTKHIVIYLDVDGVVNALKPDWLIKTQKSNRVSGFKITWNTDIISRLRSIGDRPDVEIVWLTTWGSEASTKIAPTVGLDTYRYLHGINEYTKRPDRKGGHMYSNSDSWWKLHLLNEDLDSLLESDRGIDAIVWLDDDLGYVPDKVLSDRTKLLGVKNLPIVPDSRTGLSHGDLDQIEKFIEWVLEEPLDKDD